MSARAVTRRLLAALRDYTWWLRWREHGPMSGGKITLRLSPEAKRGWEKVALDGGVTLTALMEAIGQALDERGKISTPLGLELLEKARRIDKERRMRGMG